MTPQETIKVLEDTVAKLQADNEKLRNWVLKAIVQLERLITEWGNMGELVAEGKSLTNGNK